MTAVLVPTADRDAWLAERRKGVTASEIAAVCGVAPEKWNSAYRLWLVKTGQIADTVPESRGMRFGKFAEPFVVEAFAEACPEFRVYGNGVTLYRSSVLPWQMATPDRLVYDAGPSLEEFLELALAVLQCKAGHARGEGWGPEGSAQIPLHYYLQILWEMDVMGVTTGFLANCEPPGMDLQVWEVTLDEGGEADLEVARAKARDFLTMVETRTAPEIDWSVATRDALKALHPDVEERVVEVPKALARKYRSACAAVKSAEQRKHLAENLLRDRMGSARRAVVAGSYVPDKRGVHVPEMLARRDVYDTPAKTIERRAFTTDKIVPVTIEGPS